MPELIGAIVLIVIIAKFGPSLIEFIAKNWVIFIVLAALVVLAGACDMPPVKPDPSAWTWISLIAIAMFVAHRLRRPA